MTVYFLRADELIKIGLAADVEQRVSSIAASFANGAVLLGTVEGGADVEGMLHALLADDRVEGEWFRPGENVWRVIREVCRKDGRQFGGSRGSTSRASLDQAIARRLLIRLFTEGSQTFARNLETAFQALWSHNPDWSRRRVRAIWNMEAKRIDLFEFRDLLHVAGVPRADWAEWICPELRDEDNE